MALPNLTDEQRAEALERAKVARKARAAHMDKLRNGEVSISETIELGRTDDIIGRIKVMSLIETQQGVGKAKAERIMQEAGIAVSRRVRGLGVKQAKALCDIFG